MKPSKLNNKHSIRLADMLEDVLQKGESVVNENHIDRQSIFSLASKFARPQVVRDSLDFFGVANENPIFSDDEESGEYSDDFHTVLNNVIGTGVELITGNYSGAINNLASAVTNFTGSAIRDVLGNRQLRKKAWEQFFDHRVGAKQDFQKMTHYLRKLAKYSQTRETLRDWLGKLSETYALGPKETIRVVRYIKSKARKLLKKFTGSRPDEPDEVGINTPKKSADMNLSKKKFHKSVKTDHQIKKKKKRRHWRQTTLEDPSNDYF